MSPTPQEVGRTLIEESSGYDIALPMTDERELAVRGLVIRGRRFIKGALVLADAGQNIEAMLLVRSATEYAITLGWLLKNLDDNVQRFLLNGIDDRLHWDALLACITGEHRLAADQRLMLLEARDEIKQRSSGHRMPKLKQRATEAGVSNAYVRYVAHSQVAAHPTMWAMDMFLEESAETNSMVLHPDVGPGRQAPDAYFSGVHVLGLLLYQAAIHEGADQRAERIHTLVAQIGGSTDIAAT